MKLQEIFMKHGISLFDNAENLRNPIDILEDMYLKLGSRDFTLLMSEIMEEEKFENLFDLARARKYRGV